MKAARKAINLLKSKAGNARARCVATTEVLLAKEESESFNAGLYERAAEFHQDCADEYEAAAKRLEPYTNVPINITELREALGVAYTVMPCSGVLDEEKTGMVFVSMPYGRAVTGRISEVWVAINAMLLIHGDGHV